jgi:DNA-binding transcriptional regulator GbsR (MarR family)
MNMFFKGLGRDQIAKVNELIKGVNENDEHLEKQEDLHIDDKNKNEKLEKALAHKKERIKF